MKTFNSIVRSYRPLLLTPVQLLPHDLDDARQRFIGRLHVQEAQARSPGDDVDGGAGVLLNGIQHLRRSTRLNEDTLRGDYWLERRKKSALYLALDVRELGHQSLPYDGPPLTRHLSHLRHFEGLGAVRGGQVLRDLRTGKSM